MVRIGIYDRYLSTAGGGERYSCKAAEILSRQQGYQVDLLTDLHADLNQLSGRLGLDLSQVRLKHFAFISPHYAQNITSDYDLFINATYLSSLPAYGAVNLYLCYFPTPFDVDFGWLHRFLLLFRGPALALFHLAEKWCPSFRQIEILSGLYEPQRFLLGRGSWTSGQASLKFSGPAVVGLKNPSSSPLDQLAAEIKVIAENGMQTIPLALERGQARILDLGRGPLQVEIKSDTFSLPGKDTRELGAVAYQLGTKNPLKKFLLKIIGYIPQFIVSYPRNLDFLDTYQGIISISRYSQKWIEQWWKRRSELLFPPVEVEQFKPGKKQKAILSVGRFFPEHHNKKQLEMVETFKQLCDQHSLEMEGYQLYLAGGLSPKKEHQDYMRAIEASAKGYPVHILPNIGYDQLRQLFAQSTFFWHAAGMGEDEARHPEKFEHFGITTVEAMAAGCVPIVINKGGQREIIRDKIDGYLFDSLEQLKQITLDAVQGRLDLKLVADRARERAQMFSSQNFSQKLLKIVQDYLRHGSEHNNRKL